MGDNRLSDIFNDALGYPFISWLEVLALVPWGFRWTWKLAIYLHLCVVTFFKLTSERDRWVVTLALVGCLSLGVCFNGRHVNFSALNKGLYSNGLPAILQETSECLVAASVPPQARLAGRRPRYHSNPIQDSVGFNGAYALFSTHDCSYVRTLRGRLLPKDICSSRSHGAFILA